MKSSSNHFFSHILFLRNNILTGNMKMGTTMKNDLDDVMRNYEKEGLLHEMFKRQAQKTPNKVSMHRCPFSDNEIIIPF